MLFLCSQKESNFLLFVSWRFSVDLTVLLLLSVLFSLLDPSLLCVRDAFAVFFPVVFLDEEVLDDDVSLVLLAVAELISTYVRLVGAFQNVARSSRLAFDFLLELGEIKDLSQLLSGSIIT